MAFNMVLKIKAGIRIDPASAFHKKVFK